jgi:hypothetical protein
MNEYKSVIEALERARHEMAIAWTPEVSDTLKSQTLDLSLEIIKLKAFIAAFRRMQTAGDDDGN